MSSLPNSCEARRPWHVLDADSHFVGPVLQLRGPGRLSLFVSRSLGPFCTELGFLATSGGVRHAAGRPFGDAAWRQSTTPGALRSMQPVARDPHAISGWTPCVREQGSASVDPDLIGALASGRHLDGVDFDDPEIRELKPTLAHRSDTLLRE